MPKPDRGPELPTLPYCPVCKLTMFPTVLGGLEHDVCRVVHRRGPRADITAAHVRHLVAARRVRGEDRVAAVDYLTCAVLERDRARDLCVLLEAETAGDHD